LIWEVEQLERLCVNYPADEESRGIDEGSSPSAEICASNSLLQQNPVISKNLHTVRVTGDDDVSAQFQEMSEYREHDHSQIMKLATSGQERASSRCSSPRRLHQQGASTQTPRWRLHRRQPRPRRQPCTGDLHLP
jgi:hypothetical protein